MNEDEIRTLLEGLAAGAVQPADDLRRGQPLARPQPKIGGDGHPDIPPRRLVNMSLGGRHGPLRSRSAKPEGQTNSCVTDP